MIQQIRRSARVGQTYRSVYRSKPGLCHYIHTFARRCFLQFAGRSCLPGRCQRRAYNYQRHGGDDIDHSRIAPGSERELVCSPLSALVPTPGRSFCPPLIVSSVAALPIGPIVVSSPCLSSPVHLLLNSTIAPRRHPLADAHYARKRISSPFHSNLPCRSCEPTELQPVRVTALETLTAFCCPERHGRYYQNKSRSLPW